LEPVYGLIAAYLIFGDAEKMTTGFYVGTAIVLATILANARLRKIKS
jgi:hypothetical protein